MKSIPQREKKGTYSHCFISVCLSVVETDDWVKWKVFDSQMQNCWENENCLTKKNCSVTMFGT